MQVPPVSMLTVVPETVQMVWVEEAKLTTKLDDADATTENVAPGAKV